MDPLLRFISQFGSSAELRSLSAVELRQAMQDAGLSEEAMAAILTGNRADLTQLLRTSGDIVCCILPEQPDEEEPEQEGDVPEEPPKALAC